MKLLYFPGRGRVELSRLMLEDAAIPYEFEQIPKESWPERKNEMPFLQMPVLVLDDGMMIPQSMAVARYVAKLTGAYPSDIVLAARVDAVVDELNDLRTNLMKSVYGVKKDTEEEKRAYESGLQSAISTLKNDLKLIEKLIVDSQSGFIFGGQSPTLADYTLSQFIDILAYRDLELSMLNELPRIKRVYDAVMTRPNVVAYYASSRALPRMPF